MKDPTPLVNHVYEMYTEYMCGWCSPADNEEMVKQLYVQGKNSRGLFSSMYAESPIPLRGFPGYNQYIYRNDMHKGDIDTPSKKYVFSHVSKDVPDIKFTSGGDEAPECKLWIHKPDAAATKTLLATCSKISKHQPVNHLLMLTVYCKEITCEEMLTISRSVQSVAIIDSDLPLNFWRNILQQLSDCTNLRHLWIVNSNLHQLEEDLDELLENLGRRGPTYHQVNVQLPGNTFSEKFVKKWTLTSSAVECHFVDSFVSDLVDFKLDEINWRIEEHCNSKFLQQ